MNLGGGRGVGSMSGPPRKPVDGASDEFPVGLRVLVVDDDPTCLKILERMLITCRYEVTKCNRVEYALNELRMNKNGFDVVISDVHMPNMDGFKLLEYVGLEMDLPVIMMSADDSKNVVMKGVKHGACDYLTKPVRMEALKNIWQHVVRKKKNEWQEHEQCERAQKHDANEDDWRSSKRKGDDEEADEKDDYASFKKARVVWSVELHQQFVAAVNHLGIDKAVPKTILELMNVPGLTRENVASHLQKYRLCLRKINGEPWHLGGLNNSFMGSPNPGFGTTSSLGGIDLQTLAGYQRIRLPVNAGISMPFHQMNALGLEPSKFRVSELQHLPQFRDTNKPSCLPHGIPAAMEQNQLTSFYQYAESLGSMNKHMNPQTSQSFSSLMQMVRPQGSQPILSTGAPVGALPRSGLSDYNQGTSCTSPSQSSPVVDFSVDHLPTFTGVIQEEASLNTKGSGGFDPSYDLFSELFQQEPHVWQTSSIENVIVSPSLLANQENQGRSENHIDGNNNMPSTGPELQQGDNIHSVNNLLVDNASSSVKPAELVQELSSASNNHSFEFDQDNLLSIMLKQQDEDIGPVEGEFNCDGYALDDPLVGSILSDC